MSSRSDIDSSITKVCEDERVASAFGPSSSIKLPIKISNSPPTTSEEQDNNVRSTSATSTSEVDMNKTRLNRSSGSSLGSPDGSYQNDSSSNNNNDSHRHQYRRQSSSQYNAEETANILSRRRRAIGGEEEEDSFPLPHAVYIYAACAALNSCNLGYDIGVNTNAAIKLRDSMNLTNVQIEIFMGSLNLFAMLGALGSHFVSDRLGRRGAFMVRSS